MVLINDEARCNGRQDLQRFEEFNPGVAVVFRQTFV
jgi:hypothetical protein